MIWGIGAGLDRSVEIVQAVIETDPLVPIVPPATITILGPDPSFDGGNSDDQLFYCRQRGIGAEDAVSMVVNGFCKEVFRELPMEFAVEASKLLSVTLEGAVG